MTELYEKAVLAVTTERKCSASFIQRRFSISYNKAAGLVEKMEDDGIVSSADHIGKREILIEKPTDTVDPQVTITVGETSLSGSASEIKDALKIVNDDKGKFKSDPDFEAQKDNAYRVTATELRSFIERHEQLQAKKQDFAEQQKQVMGEAKSRGYDTKTIRKIIALRKMDPQQISEEEAILELYKEALGM